MTRDYETMVIVHPESVGEKLDAVVNKYTGILEEQKARLVKLDNWGERRLAYPIRKLERGIYLLFHFEASAEALAEFERRLRLDEGIVRYQSVRYTPGQEAAPAQQPAETAAAPAGDAPAEAE